MKSRKGKYFLDQTTLEQIIRSKEYNRRYLLFMWEYYSSLAYQRSQIYDKLKAALISRVKHDVSFTRWCRTVKYRYTLQPLSAKGSLQDPGGRFNIGAIDTTKFTVFPAHYLAENKHTSESEAIKPPPHKELLDEYALALTTSQSTTTVVVNGFLETVFDISDPKSLDPFLDCIREFSLPHRLISESRSLGLKPDPFPVRTRDHPLRSILDPNWLQWPVQGDVPANCQILGQIIKDAGIVAVQYPSVITKNKCLAIYPENIHNTESYVELNDPVPTEDVSKRIDKSNFEKCWAGE